MMMILRSILIFNFILMFFFHKLCLINTYYLQGMYDNHLMDPNLSHLNDESPTMNVKQFNNEDEEQNVSILKGVTYHPLYSNPLWLLRQTRLNRLFGQPLWISRHGR